MNISQLAPIISAFKEFRGDDIDRNSPEKMKEFIQDKGYLKEKGVYDLVQENSLKIEPFIEKSRNKILKRLIYSSINVHYEEAISPDIKSSFDKGYYSKDIDTFYEEYGNSLPNLTKLRDFFEETKDGGKILEQIDRDIIRNLDAVILKIPKEILLLVLDMNEKYDSHSLSTFFEYLVQNLILSIDEIFEWSEKKFGFSCALRVLPKAGVFLLVQRMNKFDSLEKTLVLEKMDSKDDLEKIKLINSKFFEADPTLLKDWWPSDAHAAKLFDIYLEMVE